MENKTYYARMSVFRGHFNTDPGPHSRQLCTYKYHDKPVYAMQWNPRYFSMVRITLTLALILPAVFPHGQHYSISGLHSTILVFFVCVLFSYRFHAGIEQLSGSRNRPNTLPNTHLNTQVHSRTVFWLAR